MKILTDYHHADLAYSHRLVFGDRFGWDVVHPWGMGWYDRDYWAFEKAWHGDAVARQYLQGIWGDAQPDANGIVRVPDTRHAGRELVGISIEAALEQRWDVVLSSVPSNADGFAALARQTGAQFGIHVGNQWGDEAWHRRPDFAIVTTTSVVPADVRHVVVHQEFSLDDFRYEPPQGFGPIRSFVNCFQETPDYPKFQQTARSAPEFSWDVFGAVGTGQVDEFTRHDLHGTALIGQRMREAGAIWHAKHWSDGFGHVIHNAFAVGRPVIGYQRYYADKLAGPLWVEGVTSYDVESRSIDETFALMRRLRDEPDRYLAMCEAAAARFREIVDFAEDARKIAELVGAGVPA